MQKKSFAAIKPGFKLDLPSTSKKLHVCFSPSYLDLNTQSGSASLTVRMPFAPGMNTAMLAIDAYTDQNPIHPEGHHGWWVFQIEPNTDFEFSFQMVNGLLQVDGIDLQPSDSWVNTTLQEDDLTGSIRLHLVLRHRLNNSILSQQTLLLYQDERQLKDDQDIAHEYLPAAHEYFQKFSHGFNFPKNVTVHIISQKLPSFNQIINMPTAIMAARRLVRNGITCKLYASSFDPKLRFCVNQTKELLDTICKDDLVIYFYNDYDENLVWIHSLKCRKAFIYLGLPSTAHLQAFDAESYQQYNLAKDELSLAKNFDVVIASSQILQNEVEDFYTRMLNNEDDIELGNSQAKNKIQFSNEVVTAQILDRHNLWCETSTSSDVIDYANPLLVCPVPIEPCYDLLATIELFELISKQFQNASFVIICAQARPVYFQYIEYQLSTRFESIRHQVHIVSNATDSDLKAVIEQSDALIQMGPLTPWIVEDAKIFGKRLFVDGELCSGLGCLNEYSNTFRLYGTLEDRADAIVALLDQPLLLQSSLQLHSVCCQENKQVQKEFWQVLEKLVSL